MEWTTVGSIPSIYFLPDFITPAEEASLVSEVHASRAKWVELSGRRLQSHGGSVHEKGLIPAPIPSWLQPIVSRLHEQTASIDLYGDGPPNHVLVNSYQPGEGIMPHEDGPAYHPGVCIISLGGPAVIRFTRKQADGSRPQQSGDENPHEATVEPPLASSRPIVDQQASPLFDSSSTSLLLMPRSLLVFKDDAYTLCLHGIDQVEDERLDSSICNLHCCPESVRELAVGGAGGSIPRGCERVSLTVRRVPRVIKGFVHLAKGS